MEPRAGPKPDGPGEVDHVESPRRIEEQVLPAPQVVMHDAPSVHAIEQVAQRLQHARDVHPAGVGKPQTTNVFDGQGPGIGATEEPGHTRHAVQPPIRRDFSRDLQASEQSRPRSLPPEVFQDERSLPDIDQDQVGFVGPSLVENADDGARQGLSIESGTMGGC